MFSSYRFLFAVITFITLLAETSKRNLMRSEENVFGTSAFAISQRTHRRKLSPKVFGVVPLHAYLALRPRSLAVVGSFGRTRPGPVLARFAGEQCRGESQAREAFEKLPSIGGDAG